MVTFYDEIVPELHDFIIAQHIFFTGSAPLHLPNSHVNVSPKGLADTTFTIVNPKCVWYQDSTGSGVETISHLYDNGRITIMFCSFGPEAKIVRLFGRGTVYEVPAPAPPNPQLHALRCGRKVLMGSLGVRSLRSLFRWRRGCLLRGR